MQLRFSCCLPIYICTVQHGASSINLLTLIPELESLCLSYYILAIVITRMLLQELFIKKHQKHFLLPVDVN